MSTIVTRAGKGSALTHNEVDANFTNLNTDKVEKAVTLTPNYLLKGNGTNSATVSSVYDGGAGKVGFNTTSPSNQVSVGSGSLSTISLDWTGDNGAKAFWSADHSTGEVRFSAFTNYFPTFYANNSEKLRITLAGNIHPPAGSTTMSNGFFYIPAAAGAPSGTPTAISGTVPMYYDTTNNQFYVYNGAWKKVALA